MPLRPHNLKKLDLQRFGDARLTSETPLQGWRGVASPSLHIFEKYCQNIVRVLLEHFQNVAVNIGRLKPGKQI